MKTKIINFSKKEYYDTSSSMINLIIKLKAQNGHCPSQLFREKSLLEIEAVIDYEYGEK